ncbi:MAG: phosphoribosylamine--glycine ligase [Clostridia bacterium]|nr:phosphoribosylamine--glycine ligase [Clostridia bacterium]
MNIMVIGGGGREHAIVRALKRSDKVSCIYALPGNGGIASEAICVPIAATDIERIEQFALDNRIDFAAVIPDDPLSLGLTDRLRSRGIRCFGPSAAAAKIESSKAYAKDLMRRYGIPTAGYAVFDDRDDAVAYALKSALPVVVKADGLALGKGVAIAQTYDEAVAAIDSMMLAHRFGDSGRTVVIEEFLCGVEASLLTFTDGVTTVAMPALMDHKRALDGDLGDNTGGMGAIAPNPHYTAAIADECMRRIVDPTVNALRAEGREFKGCLYFGLMLTADGPRVLEYNCRFGDPETQAVLPLLEGSLFDIMDAIEDGRLHEVAVSFSDKSSCCLVLASDGYPGSYHTGNPIAIRQEESPALQVFHAGTRLDNGELLTSGGRVLGVTAIADSVPDAVSAAYAAAEHISFEGKYMRSDIGSRAIDFYRKQGK